MTEYTGRTVRLRGTSPDERGELLVRTRSRAALNNLDLIEQLSAVSPALGEARREQVNALGSMVPHVFMAKVLARVGECLMHASPLERDQLRPEVVAILAVLENAAASADGETRGVIGRSFLGDGKRKEFFAELRPMLGSRLAALARA
jgi:hypothetical protein